MTVRLSAIFEEHVEKIIHNWKMAKKRIDRRRNKFSSSNSEISVNNESSSTSEEVNGENLTFDSQEDMYSDDDDTPLNILRNKQTTESDSTSQSIDNKLKLKMRRSSPESEEEYEPSINYNKQKRIRPFNSSSSEEEGEEDVSSNGDGHNEQGTFHRKSLRQRPVKKRSLLYESSDSDTNSSLRKKRKRIKQSSDSDSDSKSSRTTANDNIFIAGVSSRGRVRKMTERAKALFGKK